jgi:indole-3-glycerol phosphate synthase
MNILEKIIAKKKEEVERLRRITPVGQLQDGEFFARSAISLAGRLTAAGASGIIAEFKRRSPSKGIINDKADVVEVARGYEQAGASGMSVLTDATFFGGSSDDLVDVRSAVGLPLLRKDFIIDPYQVYQTKAMGADVILLIAANLDRVLCSELADLARQLDLEVLLELHAEEELGHITNSVNMVGVNNRNLKTFEVDIAHSISLGEMIDDGFIRIAESGLSDTENIQRLRRHGFRGFLIGEYFMKQPAPAAACASLIRKLN